MCLHHYKDLQNLKGTEGTCRICLENVQAQVIMKANSSFPSHKYGKPPQSAFSTPYGRLQSKGQFYLRISIPFAQHAPNTCTRACVRARAHTHIIPPLYLLIKPLFSNVLQSLGSAILGPC